VLSAKTFRNVVFAAEGSAGSVAGTGSGGVQVAYLVSPVQLIPSFIPVIGQMDEVAVLYCGMRMIRRWAPGELIAECEVRARASEMVQRLTVGRCGVASERVEDVARQVA
jgi:uncharacterized membrane protein YkvA (DUF1232 family)